MGAMVLCVAHRFEHALLSFCSLLFHRSNFKDFTANRLELSSSPYTGDMLPPYTTQQFPAIPNSLFALIGELVCAMAQNNGFVLTTQHIYYSIDSEESQVKILLNLHNSRRELTFFTIHRNWIPFFYFTNKVIPFTFPHFLHLLYHRIMMESSKIFVNFPRPRPRPSSLSLHLQDD